MPLFLPAFESLDIGNPSLPWDSTTLKARFRATKDSDTEVRGLTFYDEKVCVFGNSDQMQMWREKADKKWGSRIKSGGESKLETKRRRKWKKETKKKMK
jgi:hypothetical protein